ncbi:MAG: TIR domain-containing protein [Pyrinomonadaceae bacterium]
MSEPYQYDVFISHSAKDKPAVRELAERLKADGLRVWLDEWEIRPGDMIGLRINQGLEQSRTLVLIMSANASESEWVTFESQTIFFSDPTNRQRRFIPVRLDGAEIKGTLKQFAYVDWRGKSAEQYERLLAACRPPIVAGEPAIEQKGDPQSGKVLKGHTSYVLQVAVTPDERRIVSGSHDKTLRVWDADSGKCLATLEGHTGGVSGVAVMADGRRIVSSSGAKTLRVWDADSGKCLATLEGHTDWVIGVAVTADGRRIVSGSDDNTLRVWELPPFDGTAAEESGATHYTNAKVLLVGDSGVGKSGLAYRLTEDRFVSTISTDAAWATQLKLAHDTSSEETEREIWLWDFAGQADYRLIHQLFMDETSLAVLVFNPQSEDPFEGLGQWDRDLQRAARRPFKKLLVAGRCDRGGLMVSRATVERFRQERGFTDYLETSASTGDGCIALRDAIIRNIPWDEIPWTSSPRTFKLLKAEIVKLKDEGKALLRMGELKQQLEMRLPGEAFTLEELRAVVGLLTGPGIVWQLEFGDFVLLQPERINAYAAAVIRKVRAHTDEIGVIPEEDVRPDDSTTRT